MLNKKLNRCMFIGLPNSGKSSFIGALWHVVESGEINEAYTVATQPDDREYLNFLRDSWLGCVKPERTKTEFIKRIELHFKDNHSLAEANFLFPDLSGETYELQFEHRKLTQDYIESINESNGIMLFINPAFLKKSNLITDAQEITFGLIEFDDDSANMDIAQDIKAQVGANPNDIIDKRGKSETEWKSKMAQTQVVLIDLLQMILNRVTKPCKLGIIISAWDLIKNTPDQQVSSLEPSTWFFKELPMLQQFLVSNSTSFKPRVFGVSAQGASYKGDVTVLQAMINQSERIKVQDGAIESHDITIPIKWLLNG